MEPTTCRTLAAPVVARLEDRRSVFECWLRRVEDEADARGVVDEARRTLWDARHHCSAFVLGVDASVVRSNDDGEPAGSAGMPMLEALTHAGLTDVVAVVSRWFGGTKLGTGGLARAYGGAVREALEQAVPLTRVLVEEVDVRIGHDLAGRLEHDLRARGVSIGEARYAQEVTLPVLVPVRDAPSLPDLLAELSGGQADLVAASARRRWVDAPDDT